MYVTFQITQMVIIQNDFHFFKCSKLTFFADNLYKTFFC